MPDGGSGLTRQQRRALTRQFQREAGETSGGYFLDIVHVADRAFAGAIYAWAAHATAADPALCLFPDCAAQFGPGHGLPRLVAFVRALGGAVAMAGGICGGCAERTDLERAVLAAFGFDSGIRLFDRGSVIVEGGRA
jgi:hypothetical protein